MNKPTVSVKLPMGQRRGNPKVDRDSVETARGILLDWSDLQDLYDKLGTLAKVAEFFDCRVGKVYKEAIRRGVVLGKRGLRKGHKKSALWHQAHQAAMKRPEVIQKYRENLIKRFATMRGPCANSPLEKLLHRALKKAGISFSTQRALINHYVVDILISQKSVVIEADGVLHRLHPAKDIVRDQELTNAGYRVFRFCGKEINRDPDGCIKSVITACDLHRDAKPVYDIRNGMVGKDNPNWKEKIAIPCSACGKILYSTLNGMTYKHKFCNVRCYAAWFKIHPEYVPSRWTESHKEVIVCKGCGKKFQATRWEHRKYCTKQCWRKSQKNMTQSELTGNRKSLAEMTRPAMKRGSNKTEQKAVSGRHSLEVG
jgi:very-short-patch-repair endonuclease